MIKPEDLNQLTTNNYNLDDLEKKIDNSIIRFHGWYPWEEAIIEDEIPMDIRNQIAQRYKDAGWNYVYHRTSSENNERPGLTSFKFSMEPIKPEYINDWNTI